MARPKYVIIDNKPYLWSEIVNLRREQVRAAATPEQPMLFSDLKTDYRPPGERSAVERYLSPSLFDTPKL
jgi:hypothetical protein